jgi:uncharacterized protein with GYD domain
MPTYIALCRWTQKGIETVKKSPERLDQFKQAVKSAGGEVKGFFLTMGQYDFVVILEMPDDAAGARLTLSVGAQGNVRTETLKSFAEAEYRQILSSLP